MRVLLDTHAFIWWDDEVNKLSARALAVCQDTNNTLLLSMASVWEMQIKTQLGKLQFTIPLQDKIYEQQRTNFLRILSIELGHVFKLDSLPHHHRDPFDRLMIAQAIGENIPIVTHDPAFAHYPTQIIW